MAVAAAIYLIGADSFAAGDLDVSWYYKNLLSLTTVEDNFGRLGVTDEEVAVDDTQRVRIKADYAPWESVDLRVEYETQFAWGEMVRIRNQLEQLPGERPGIFFLPPRTRFLDLESEIADGSDWVWSHQLDRLRLRWVTDDLELAVGRQAVSWGSGLIWTPTDLFSAFSPTEIDRDEKPGVDVVRLTWTMTGETYIDLIGEPLGEEGPYSFDADDSSLALRVFTHVGEYDLAALGGQIGGDNVIGGDFSGYLRDAGFRGEWVFTDVKEHDQRDYGRGLLSLDYGFAAPWNPYVAVEYFYNGLGTSDPDDYLPRLTESSVQRAFQRGNAFNIGRNLVGAVLGLVPSGRWSLQSVTLVNLDDGSAQEFATATRSLSDNVDLVFGLNVGIGPPGTEFGGYSVEQAGVEFKNADLYYLFLKAYF